MPYGKTLPAGRRGILQATATLAAFLALTKAVSSQERAAIRAFGPGGPAPAMRAVAEAT